MSTYISGGCKNGKSFYAQRVAKAGGSPLYYIATMIPHDDEDLARIRRHREERAGWGFETLECGRSILSCLDAADSRGSFLLDSVTALFSDAILYDALTEAYRRGLAHIDRRLAALCDNVIEVVGGQFIVHKGVLPV